MPNVSVRVMGMHSASIKAERHPKKPTSATITTSPTASNRLRMNKLTLSTTWRGWSLVRAITRSSGSVRRMLSRVASTWAPKSPI